MGGRDFQCKRRVVRNNHRRYSYISNPKSYAITSVNMSATRATVRTAPVQKLTLSAGGVEQRARRGVSISPSYLP